MTGLQEAETDEDPIDGSFSDCAEVTVEAQDTRHRSCNCLDYRHLVVHRTETRRLRILGDCET